jgi:hypothetical protein
MDEYPELASAGLVITLAAVLLVCSHLYLASRPSELSSISASNKPPLNNVASVHGGRP